MATALEKLAAVTAVPEPKDVSYNVNLTIWTYGFNGEGIYEWDLSGQVTDVRLRLSTQQASTVEIDLEDSDFTVLDHPVLAHWAFNVQDVSLSSARKFSTSRITSSTNNAYLGDSANLEWVLGQRPIDMNLGDVAFRLCGITTQQTTTTLIFEDRSASYLRDDKGFKTVDRGKSTRAHFVKALCDQAGVDVWIPELALVEPIQTQGQVVTSGTTGLPGLTMSSGVTVKGAAATRAQIAILNTALQTAVSLSAPALAQQALIAALITENSVSNPNPGDAGDEGVLSIIASTAAGLPFSPYDVAASCAYFLNHGFTGQGGAIAIANGNPRTPAYAIAQAVQGSGAGAGSNGASNYGPSVPEAVQIVNAYVGKGNAIPATVPGSYAFTRGPNETSWDCIQRLASEVAWYAFVRQNRLWFVSGNYLFAQQAQMDVERGQRGVDYVDVNLDMGARDQIASLTVAGRATLWAALPGMVVNVLKRGPATGKWFVSAVSTHPLDPSQEMQATLQKPLPERAEPSAAPRALKSAAKTQDAVIGTGKKGVVKAAQWALDHPQNFHWQEVRPIPSSLYVVPNVTDCSGLATLCYKAAGLPDPNGSNYDGNGNTDTLQAHGKATTKPQPGDLAFYSNPDHVTIYMGNGQCVSHGGSGAGVPIKISVNYRSVSQYRTY